jgi:VanZ family protein
VALSGGRPSRRAGAWITLCSILAIGALTLSPGGLGPPPSTASGYLVTDVVLNVILFTPLGVGLALLGIRPGIAIALGFLTSTSIELAQLWVIPERFASVHDVLTNTLGTAFAVILTTHWHNRSAWWPAIAPWVLGAVALCWALGAFLVRPSTPIPGRWYPQWAHEFGGSQFRGTILSLSLQGIPLPDGHLDNTEGLRESLRRGDPLRFSITLRTGPDQVGSSQIAGLISGDHEELAGVWQHGNSIRARIRLRLSDAMLRNPWVVVEDALPSRPGDTVTVLVEGTRHQIRLRVIRDGTTQERTLRLAPELFWSGLFPFDFAASRRTLWWPIIPAVPSLGAMGLAGHKRPWLLTVGLAVALLLAPAAAGISLPGWPLLVTAAVAVGLGALVAQRIGI